MLGTAVSHLARRGVSAAMDADGEMPTLSTAVMLVLLVSIMIFMPLVFFVEYTFGRLLPTLLIIEDPRDEIVFDPLATEDLDNTNKSPERAAAGPTYVTSSLRGFNRFLGTIGGWRSRFRGLGVYVVDAFASAALAGILSSLPLLNLLPWGVAQVMASVLCANLSLTWTHIVISEPSPKPWFRRIPSMRVWKRIAAPTALLTAASQISFYLPYFIGRVSGAFPVDDLYNLNGLSHGRKAAVGATGLALLLLSMVLQLCLIIPAKVIMIRIQASLLPDDDETIVPFDRSFGGMVEPAIVGGSGMIGIRDAWHSFPKEARIRLVKAYGKVFLLVFTLAFTFVLSVALFSGIVPQD